MKLVKEINATIQLDEADALSKIASKLGNAVGGLKNMVSGASAAYDAAKATATTNPVPELTPAQIAQNEKDKLAAEFDNSGSDNLSTLINSFLSPHKDKLILIYCTSKEALDLVGNKADWIDSLQFKIGTNGKAIEIAHGYYLISEDKQIVVQELLEFDSSKIKKVLDDHRNLLKICIFNGRIESSLPIDTLKTHLKTIISNKTNYKITLQASAVKKLLVRNPGAFNSVEDLLPVFDVTIGKNDPENLVSHFTPKNVWMAAAQEWENSQGKKDKEERLNAQPEPEPPAPVDPDAERNKKLKDITDKLEYDEIEQKNKHKLATQEVKNNNELLKLAAGLMSPESEHILNDEMLKILLIPDQEEQKMQFIKSLETGTLSRFKSVKWSPVARFLQSKVEGGTNIKVKTLTDIIEDLITNNVTVKKPVSIKSKRSSILAAQKR